MGMVWDNFVRKFLFLLIGIALGYTLSMIQYAHDIKNAGHPAATYNQDVQRRFSIDGNIRPPQEPEKKNGPRKILLDCGANVASTVQLFRETYPDGRDYTIHSFELDSRLAPYFASYSDHVLHCPVAVAGKDGNITAYAETAWRPDKGKVAGADMQWGGGSIYVYEAEKKNGNIGRHLGFQNVIPMVDLSRWIRKNTAQEDYVIFKIDVEGAEYEILEKMLKEGTFKWIDKWVYSNCTRSPGGPARLALTVQVGMNRKAAHKLVETIRAHHSKMPVTLFVYGDFVQEYPDLVTQWAQRYTIGMRENAPFPEDHWDLQNTNVVRMGMISAVQRMREVGLQPAYFYPSSLSKQVKNEASRRGLRIIQSTTKFPPNIGTLLTEKNYYRFRDVERTPKALRILHERISYGGILTLDSDHPDSYMISAFLMDYLYENSGFELVSIDNCLK
ncbi:PREDICTED: uncharacterized protein LOC109462283 [Branchiostoma belcheri]|uniref:Uncharacterized protein LOC109462283 n=1 Tax=Branchiostoma belcheri TaxID=7741 RepID=A0A6P4XQI0_BRABE|nr:PREDICTED: uncharacterized protein LOC109462283 [Branchiostoma belcheri]